MNDELWSSVWLTRDVCQYRGQIEVAGVIITASEGTKTVVTLRNGDNSTSPIIVTLRVAADGSTPFSFFSPIYCYNGIFADVDDNTTGVMVVYRPIKE